MSTTESPKSFAIVPPSPTQLLPGDDTRRHLAMALAMNIKPRATITADYGLTEDEVEGLLTTDQYFRELFRSYQQYWNSPSNAAERIRVKAATMVEDSLPGLWGMMHDPAIPAASRVEIHKHLMRLADMEPKRGPGDVDAPPFFQLTLNMGGEERAVPAVVPRRLDFEDAA
jgi:hypothetical protein